jgi:hypothetical protein
MKVSAYVRTGSVSSEVHELPIDMIVVTSRLPKNYVTHTHTRMTCIQFYTGSNGLTGSFFSRFPLPAICVLTS